GAGRASPRLPDDDALLGGQVHLVAGFHGERRVEARLILEWRGAADRRRGMRIDLDALDGFILADLASPHLYPAQVEALLPREPIDGRRCLAGERQLVRLVSQRQTRIVRDILSESQLAVDVIAAHRLIGVV